MCCNCVSVWSSNLGLYIRHAICSYQHV
jgi:hypothetical protein